MPKKVFISGWVGAGNLGDELLFDTLVNKLRNLGVTEITTASINPAETTSRFAVQAVSHRDLIGSVREIRQSDLFILGPGGILQDDTSPWSLPYQLHRVVLARMMGIPVIGIGLGVGPLNRNWSRRLLRGVLNGPGPIAVRDEDSANLLTQLEIANVIPTADLVLSAAGPEAVQSNRIVICLRPHKPGGSSLPVAFQRDHHEASYVATMAAALDRVSRTFDSESRFVAFEPARDHALHERVAAQMMTPTSLCVPEYDTILKEVAESRAVIAMRYHSAIAALVTGRPAVMIGYAPKVASLAANLGEGFGYIPNEVSRFEELPAKLQSVIDVDPAQLARQLDQIREAESKNEDLLRAALSSDGRP